MKRILICKSFTLVRHKQAKNYGAFARLITLASFLFPDPELGLCMQTRLLLGVPCTFVFEQSSSVFVALNVFASISLMPPKKISKWLIAIYHHHFVLVVTRHFKNLEWLDGYSWQRFFMPKTMSLYRYRL